MKIYLFSDGTAVAAEIGRGWATVPAISGTFAVCGQQTRIEDGRIEPPTGCIADVVVSDGVNRWRCHNLVTRDGKITAVYGADLVRRLYEADAHAAKIADLDERVSALENKKSSVLESMLGL